MNNSVNKVCKIIATNFSARTFRENTTICGRPAGYFNHSQNFPTPESIQNLLMLNIEQEMHVNPGVGVDTFIVNNQCGYESGDEFLRKLDGKKTYSGEIKILERENFGRAFGAYNFAYSKLKNQYDYFIFTEDDVLLNGYHYAKAGIEILNKADDVGFIGYIGLSLNALSENSTDGLRLHAHGSVGIAKTRALKIIEVKYGALPHPSNRGNQSYGEIISRGEIDFSNAFIRCGFRIGEIDESLKLYDFAYDYMRGLKIPRYLAF